jgi:soluble lytic murein transglycosylase-like protein
MAIGILAVTSLMVVPVCSRVLAQDSSLANSADRRGGAVYPFAGFISEASRRFDVPEPWIRAVMRVESDGDVGAVSPKGAVGLMQIMPETWGELSLKYALGDDPYDPHDNILAGAAYLREMHDRFGSPGFLAAYSAGPTRYADHLATGRPLPPETELYLAKLAPIATEMEPKANTVVARDAQAWTKAPLFVTLAESRLMDSSSAKGERADRRLIAIPTSDQPHIDDIFIPASR